MAMPAIDRYAHFLRTIGSPVLPHDLALWIERIVLLAAVALHVTAVTQLWLRNRRAKPGGHRSKCARATWAARTMPWTGILILVFLVFHILQFSTRTIHPTPLVNGAVYANIYHAFQKWWIVLIYVVAVVLLGYPPQPRRCGPARRRPALTTRTATGSGAGSRPGWRCS